MGTNATEAPASSARTISVVVDTRGWFDEHAIALVEALAGRGHRAHFVTHYADVPAGDIAFYLSCTRLTPGEMLDRNALNLVVHASDLPRGRGFSPLVWQVLEGMNEIPLTMITMTEQADAGDIVMKRRIMFEGHELNDEMRDRMGRAIMAMCLDLLDQHEPLGLQPQRGEPSWYRKRGPQDSRLDPDISIADQFDLLRVVDNERYPAFFDLRGHRYALSIRKLGPLHQFTQDDDK